MRSSSSTSEYREGEDEVPPHGWGMGGAPTRESLKTINAALADHPWRELINDNDNVALRRARGWFQNRRRGYFFAMLDPPRKNVALDVCAGSGVVSEVLSEHYGDVVSLDWDSCYVDFMKARFAQDRQQRARVVQGGGNGLPFDSEIFDLVVLNDALHRLDEVGEDDGNASPQRVQFLRDSVRVVRSGGCVAAAVTNRLYGRRTVWGSGLTPTSGSWLRSPGAYRRHFQEVGLTDVTLYWALPGVGDPMLVLPLVDRRLVKSGLMSSAFLPRSGWKRGIYSVLATIGLLSPLMESLYVVGRKP